MSLHIKARHCTVDDAMRAYVEDKLARTRRYYSKVHAIEVIFTDEKTRFDCEIEIIAPPMYVVASAQDKDLRAAFDKAQKVVERKLKREKSRMIDTKRHGTEVTVPASPSTPVDEIAAMRELEEEVERSLEEGSL